MASILASIKQFITKVEQIFGRQNELVSKALRSPTPGAALRSAMLDNASNPEVLDELLAASVKHGLKGRP